MFHSAALRLTTWYLFIIMLISISFSTAIYHLSYGEVTSEAQRQSSFLRSQLTPYDFRDFNSSRQTQLDTEKSRLINRLAFFNLLVLLLGGLASYQLARRTLRPIEDSLEAQKRFTADASHELRTPLAAMQSEIEVALRDSGLTKKEATEILQSNLEEVGKLKDLSEGLLRLASTGSVVNIKIHRQEKSAVVEIEDNGQGIKASDLPHVFDRFYRADNSRTKEIKGGYGLGLAIAKKIADLHHGVIEVKSAPGKGSIFTILLPLA
jgi:signal transduction histidine kinase